MNIPKYSPVRVNPVMIHPAEKRLSLDGPWDFRLDPNDCGLAEKWFCDSGLLTDRVEVPGTWQGQGFGGDEKETIRDFRLQHRTLRATYTGTGWYGNTFEIPEGFHGKLFHLRFGGVHPSAQVWLNGVPIGENDLPFVPFGFDVSKLIRREEPNRIVVRVHEHNRWLGFAYNWQGNWSGLYRSVELVATGNSSIEDFRVLPDVEDESILIKLRVSESSRPDGDSGTSEEPMTLHITAQCTVDDADPLEAFVEVGGGVCDYTLPVPSPRLWSPDSPSLYRIDAVLRQGEEVLDAVSERVGFVTFKTEDKQFSINGEPYYIRGTGDFLSCPETGSPDTDRDRWRRKLQTLCDYGYNMVRCQSYVYSPEYLDVADEVGLLVQSEMGMLGGWSGHDIFHYYGWPIPTHDIRGLLKEQWDRVVIRDVNHPSANIYCMSNELLDKSLGFFPRTAWKCYHDTKAIKPTALVIWTDGGHCEDFPGDFVNHEPSEDLEKRCDKPLIQHEFRWWSSFPDVSLMERYSGAIRPYAAEIALEAATQHGLSHVLRDAAVNSQRVQFQEAKGKMEACRRDHPRMAGICHFNAMDTNPSPQGIINEFYERKVSDSATWLETNGDTVVLSEFGFDDRVLSSGDTLRCTFSVSDFSHPPLKSPDIEWSFVSENRTLAEGHIRYSHTPFQTVPTGSSAIAIPEVEVPRAATLSVTLREDDRKFHNHWDFWLFPQTPFPPGKACVYGEPEYSWICTMEGLQRISADALPEMAPNVLLSERFDDAVIQFVCGGGTVILAATEGMVRPFPAKLGLNEGRYFFTPPANYPPYEAGHNGTIVQNHPLLGDFPHEGFADLQFYRMLGESPPLDLEPLSLTDEDPIVRAIHSYPVGRPVGYLVERSLGEGAVILSALDLNQAWPESRYLLSQMTAAATSTVTRDRKPLSDAATVALKEATTLL